MRDTSSRKWSNSVIDTLSRFDPLRITYRNRSWN